MITFPDISNHQEGINLSGVAFAICKVSESTYYADPLYRTFSRQLGPGKFAAYHALGEGNAANQARFCYSLTGKTPLMVDVEDFDGSPQLGDIKTFVDTYRKLGGIVHAIYLPWWYWNNHMNSAPLARFFSDNKLFLVSSDYSGDGWEAYGGVVPSVWQYTETGNLDGWSPIDLNRYDGTLPQLKKLMGFSNSTSTPESTPTPTGGTVATTVTQTPVKSWDNVRYFPLGRRMKDFVEKYYPGAGGKVYVTSSNDSHGDGGYHDGLSYGGSFSCAADFGSYDYGDGDTKMRDFAKWLFDNFSDLTIELIHSTPFDSDNGFYVKNQSRQSQGYYGAQTEAAHLNHVHWATSEALMTQIEARAKQKWGDPVTQTEINAIVKTLLDTPIPVRNGDDGKPIVVSVRRLLATLYNTDDINVKPMQTTINKIAEDVEDLKGA